MSHCACTTGLLAMRPSPSRRTLRLLLLHILHPVLAAFITGGMMLTAARFYSTPTVANARILFRASLLHLPLFMAAFLVHRLPNRGEDKAALLVSLGAAVCQGWVGS